MNPPSVNGKRIARAAAAAFGGKPSVTRYWDEKDKACVDIVSCKESPCSGVTSFATIGVSEIPLKLDGKDINVRAEMVGACSVQFPEFANHLSTAAFCVINSGWFLAPGIIFPDVLAMYDASPTMKHFLFLPPFLWDDRLQTLKLEPVPIGWLLAIPISQAEMQLAHAKGVPDLEDLFEKKQVDIFDLRRPSVV